MIKMTEGEKITLQCRTSTSTKPMTRISWTRNGVAVPDEDATEKIVQDVQDDEENRLFMTESSLTVLGVVNRSSNYKCLAHHPGLLPAAPDVSEEIRFSILYPPGRPLIEGYTNQEKEEDKMVRSGDKLTLVCKTRGGNPPPSLVWYRDHEVVDSTSSFMPPNEEAGFGVTTNTYSLTVKPEDNKKTFRCEASNVVERISSQELRLSVSIPPVIIQTSTSRPRQTASPTTTPEPDPDPDLDLDPSPTYLQHPVSIQIKDPAKDLPWAELMKSLVVTSLVMTSLAFLALLCSCCFCRFLSSISSCMEASLKRLKRTENDKQPKPETPNEAPESSEEERTSP